MSQGTAVDTGVLQALAEDLGDAEPVREAVRLFLDDLASRRAQVRAGYEAGDEGGVRAQAHALASSSAMLGALDPSQRCRELENGQPVDAAAPDRWEQAADRAVADLRAWCA